MPPEIKPIHAKFAQPLEGNELDLATVEEVDPVQCNVTCMRSSVATVERRVRLSKREEGELEPEESEDVEA
jgi:hypothetical protein